MPLPTTTETEPFYAASLVALRALDGRERTSRRFGDDADTRWGNFAGHLRISDRIDLLLRDAAGQWGAAFSPAVVWSLPGLAVDEPFGPDWRPLPEPRAEALWARPTGADLDAALRALDIAVAPVDLPPLSATSRLIVAGSSAIVAVARAFARDSGLSWTAQVLVVAKQPRTRHLAGLVAPLLGASGPTRLVAPSDDLPATLKAVGFSAGGRAVVSSEASPGARRFAEAAGV